MLEQLSDQIRECLERAADAEYLTMEKRWLTLPSSYGFTESLGDFTTANSEWRRKFDERLRANTSTPEIRADQFPRPASTAETSDDWAQLHEISTLSIPEGNRDSLYDRILDVAVVLMSSDMASTQLLDPKPLKGAFGHSQISMVCSSRRAGLERSYPTLWPKSLPLIAEGMRRARELTGRM